MKISKHLYLIILTFLLVDLSVAAQTPFVCEGQFFLTLLNDGSSSLVETSIDPENLDVLFNPLFPQLSLFINAIGYRSSDNFIYGLDYQNKRLARIDADGTLDILADLAINPSFLYPAGDISVDGQYLWLSGGTGAALTGVDKELIKIDLNPPYTIEVIPITGVEVRLLDIAFDPLSARLYGFDARQSRLVEINTLTGEVTAPFPSVWGMARVMGSLFFDAFGQLWGYGNQGSGAQNTLFYINKYTGTVSVQAQGEIASNTDGCSCPYTVALSKQIAPRLASPCDDLRVSYLLANTAGYDQHDLYLIENFHEGFIIKEILHQPENTEILSGIGSSRIEIDGFSLVSGFDSLVLILDVPSGASGLYKGQAYLDGLPTAIGGFRYSDDPTTLIPADSTAFLIRRPQFDSLSVEKKLCKGDSITLSAPRHGDEYRWSTGAVSNEISITHPGYYNLSMKSGCDTIIVDYTIFDAFVKVHFPESNYSLLLGDELTLTPVISSNTDFLSTSWTPNQTTCTQCFYLDIRPLENTEYFIEVSNSDGCYAKDSVLVHVLVDEKIFMPNVFSPNRDGYNDLFFPQTTILAHVQVFQIFDRWGNLLFEKKGGFLDDNSIVWDGQFKDEPMPAGVYIWLLKAILPNNEPLLLEGSVLLLR